MDLYNHRKWPMKFCKFLYGHLKGILLSFRYFSFIESEYYKSEISLEEFHLLLSELLNLKNHHLFELNALFGKIDYASTGFIDWDMFCTYMHVQLCEKDNLKLNQKQVYLNFSLTI